MSAAVKICGLTTAEAVGAAVEAGAAWVGFVFFPPSPRCITPGKAAALGAQIPKTVERVGLFVEPSDEDLAAVLAVTELDALQLYTHPSRATEIRTRFGLPVWRAVSVARASDLPNSAFGEDRLVIEAEAPGGSTRPGGNAASFDWDLLKDWPSPSPWILAGGLTGENVAEAIATTGASAVDVSSGVERTMGHKDPALIRDFIQAARRCAA